MIHIIKRAVQDPFFRNSALFFFASMIVAFLNYIFHPILARLLSLQDFGDVQAIFALYGLLATVLAGFSIATVHASVNCEDQNECASIIATLRKTALVVILIIFAFLALGSQFLASQLHFSNAWLFVVLGASLIMGALQAFRNGYLQGQRDFKSVSIANIIISGGRLVFAVLFVFVGWKSFGAAFGMLAAQIVSFVFVFQKTRKILSVHASSLGSERVKQELLYVGFFAVSTIFVTVLYNTDILVVKRFFSPDIAGGYSGISTIGNIVYFSTSSFAAVLLSSIKRTHGVETRRRLFFKAVMFISLIGGVFSLICSIFPEFVTRVLMGTQYVPYASLLPWLIFAFLGASLVNVCIYFLLALRDHALIGYAICLLLFLICCIGFRHKTPLEIAQDYFIVNFVALIGASILVAKHLRVPKIASI